jgi:hypothetical protein
MVDRIPFLLPRCEAPRGIARIKIDIFVIAFWKLKHGFEPTDSHDSRILFIIIKAVIHILKKVS